MFVHFLFLYCNQTWHSMPVFLRRERGSEQGNHIVSCDQVQHGIRRPQSCRSAPVCLSQFLLLIDSQFSKLFRNRPGQNTPSVTCACWSLLSQWSQHLSSSTEQLCLESNISLLSFKSNTRSHNRRHHTHTTLHYFLDLFISIELAQMVFDLKWDVFLTCSKTLLCIYHISSSHHTAICLT